MNQEMQFITISIGNSYVTEILRTQLEFWMM